MNKIEIEARAELELMQSKINNYMASKNDYEKWEYLGSLWSQILLLADNENLNKWAHYHLQKAEDEEQNTDIV